MDIPWAKPMHVICNFWSSSVADYIQALGRGARRVNQTTQGSYLQPAYDDENSQPRDFIHNLGLKGFGAQYNENLRQAFGNMLHEKELHFDTEEAGNKFQNVFNMGGSIYYSDASADQVAVRNFNVIRTALRANNIPCPSDPSGVFTKNLRTGVDGGAKTASINSAENYSQGVLGNSIHSQISAKPPGSPIKGSPIKKFQPQI